MAVFITKVKNSNSVVIYSETKKHKSYSDAITTSLKEASIPPRAGLIVTCFKVTQAQSI